MTIIKKYKNYMKDGRFILAVDADNVSIARARTHTHFIKSRTFCLHFKKEELDNFVFCISKLPASLVL